MFQARVPNGRRLIADSEQAPRLFVIELQLENVISGPAMRPRLT
jgi:hypothetical protein